MALFFVFKVIFNAPFKKVNINGIGVLEICCICPLILAYYFENIKFKLYTIRTSNLNEYNDC